MKIMRNKEKFVMTTPLLSDSKGVKIGKSEGNVIGLTDEPSDLFGKIMALDDNSVIPMFTLLTDVSTDEIKSFDINQNPFELKKRVAKLIVEQLYNKELADKAEENFNSVFRDGAVPEDVLEVKGENKSLMEICLENSLVESKSEFKRLVGEGAVIDMESEEKVEDFDFIAKNTVYKIGKRRFIKII